MTHKPSCSCRCSCAGNTAGPNRSQRGSGQSCARHPGRHISLRNITPAARPGTCQVLVAFLSPLWRFPVRRWSHAFASRHCHSPCSVSSNRCRPRRRHHRHVRQVLTGAGRSRNTGRTHRCHSTQQSPPYPFTRCGCRCCTGSRSVVPALASRAGSATCGYRDTSPPREPVRGSHSPPTYRRCHLVNRRWIGYRRTMASVTFLSC